MTREEFEKLIKDAILKYIQDGVTTQSMEIANAISAAGLAVVPREPTPEMLDAYLRLYPSLKMGIKAGDLLVGEG